MLDIGEDDPDLLHAAQVSVGMLGVVTRLDLAVTDAYRLREHVGLRSWDDVMEHWDELVSQHRHFGFFWLPTEESGELYNLDGHGERLADQCYVKIYDEVGPDVADDDTAGRRVDRCYRIFPMVYDPNFHELEYFVALERAPEALQAMRELMLASLPDSVYPMEVRTVGADEAFLSPQHGTDTVVISVSGKPGTDYWRYLRSVDALLAEFDARVHWGKLHFLTPERLHELYPRADDFIALRRELDPQGMFLNDHLRAAVRLSGGSVRTPPDTASGHSITARTSIWRSRKARSSSRLRRSQPVTSSLHLLALHDRQAGTTLESV